MGQQLVDEKKIAILGAGAVGQLIYQQLLTDGNAPLLIARENERQKIVTFTALDGQVTKSTAILASPKSVSPLLEQVRLLIVCVKAYQVSDAIRSIIDKLSPKCHIILLHNGMGPHLEVPELLHGQGLSLGTTSQAALKHERWHIEQTGSGSTQLGHLTGPQLSQELRTRLLSAIPNSQWCEPILPSLWHKLAINAAINPLTAIHNCSNGKLAEEQYCNQISATVTELAEVASADGIELDKSALINRVYEVIGLTAANFSSMHQDVLNKRKTEIESINGYVVQRARHHQLSTKVNLSLLEQVKKMESDYLK
ncbi:2-dehydropantoate 2-reductase [Shewanella sediminis HAW-EB3]|uniref:2-dehydropantoate 2-reductase n=1 Tax=Shewanella sediminis (strain HAW-EB3) TaxID=425104 RepID=A8FYX6_SHESH|nr:2-dehydropantoate 2-reductase [Shewanella sediminis]ABV38049.1 2-dehydropantoate 2-reductase [Shewanella sediminis HAW-EB3]